MIQTQQKLANKDMDFTDDNSSDYDKEAADELYQLLLDLYTKGSSDIYVDPRTLLSSEVDAITAINRSAALEKEAQAILRVFTNSPVSPLLRDLNAALNHMNERALVPRNNINILKRKACYKIDIWKDNKLISSIENNRSKDVFMHFIEIRIDKGGSFVITGLEHVEDDVKEVIRELGGLIAMEDVENFTRKQNSGIEIKEITESNEMIEIPLHGGTLKFTSNQNPIDVLSEVYCTEETSDNSIIFKVPALGDFVVSPDDDPIEVFKAITGHDLTDFYKNAPPQNVAIAEIPENDDAENKENEVQVKKTTKQRHKKNKQKRKSKKRK